MTRGGPESSARPDGRVAGRDAPAGAAESPRRGPGCRGRTAPRGDDRLAATDEERDSGPQHFMSVGALRGSARSLRALEWLNAIVADVRVGVGPYLAIYSAQAGTGIPSRLVSPCRRWTLRRCSGKRRRGRSPWLHCFPPPSPPSLSGWSVPCVCLAQVGRNET